MTLPFERYDGRGRRLLGRAKRGDETARHGYGPPVFAQCGLMCVYCGLDMSAPYENWLQLSVDHVVPASSKGNGYPAEWIEDISNLVTCCRACNEFSNSFHVAAVVPLEVDAFFDIRDRAFLSKRDFLGLKHDVERKKYALQMQGRRPLEGPDLPIEPQVINA